jgi:hypothetical protein
MCTFIPQKAVVGSLKRRSRLATSTRSYSPCTVTPRPPPEHPCTTLGIPAPRVHPALGIRAPRVHPALGIRAPRVHPLGIRAINRCTDTSPGWRSPRLSTSSSMRKVPLGTSGQPASAFSRARATFWPVRTPPKPRDKRRCMSTLDSRTPPCFRRQVPAHPQVTTEPRRRRWPIGGAQAPSADDKVRIGATHTAHARK